MGLPFGAFQNILRWTNAKKQLSSGEIPQLFIKCLSAMRRQVGSPSLPFWLIDDSSDD